MYREVRAPEFFHEGVPRLITILDYGMGNLRSVENAFQMVGAPCQISTSLDEIRALVIPGVGAFGAAMERLSPLRDAIRDIASAGIPVLGICLGQQLLFDSSEEMGSHCGLGLIPGVVRYLPRDSGLKVPHVGWSPLTVIRKDGMFNHTNDGDQVYFVHSLYTDCAEESDIACTAEYGLTFPAAVRRENVFGVQFHPEKSGAVGLAMLKEFAVMCGC